MRVHFSDRCTVPEERKDAGQELTFPEEAVLEVHGDTLYMGGRPLAVRQEPIGLSDVHWRLMEEYGGGLATHFEVRPGPATLPGKRGLQYRQNDPAGTWSFEAPPTYTVEGGP